MVEKEGFEPISVVINRNDAQMCTLPSVYLRHKDLTYFESKEGSFCKINRKNLPKTTQIEFMSITTMVAIILNATSKIASENPRTVAALGFPACYHFRLHVMARQAKNDSRAIPSYQTRLPVTSNSPMGFLLLPVRASPSTFPLRWFVISPTAVLMVRS